MSMTRDPAPRRPRAPLLSGAAVIAFLFAAAPPAGHAAGENQGKTAAVEIQNFHFVPEMLTVTAGTTVTWTNSDETVHTIAEAKGAFRSAALDTKDTFSHTFAAPGEFVYRCTLHPMMVGKIIVKPAGD